jgi:glyoxylase-like metal-dependent hydrolase (beta-lactamase superfamily II)
MNVFHEIKGTIDCWDIMVLGHLAWNRYFGETQEDPPRGVPSTCSSVLIRGKQADGTPYGLIVDVTIRRSAEEAHFDLNRRTGLKPKAVTHCFATHHHFDHWNGMKYYMDAQWLCATGNKALIVEASSEAAGREPGDGLSATIPAERLIEVSGEFLPGIYALPLPGHTKDLHGIAFSFEGKRILVASDSVMTRNHFHDRRTEYQPDPTMQALAAETIANMAESFDIIIPGHDGPVFL